MAAVVHEIVEQPTGAKVGTDGAITVTLLDSDGKMFKRRAIRKVGSGQQEAVCWLVAELNGVRVYQQGNSVIVTTQDMYP